MEDIQQQLRLDLQHTTGIAYIYIDQQNEPTNLFSFDFLRAYKEAIRIAAEDTQIRGVVVLSAKRDYIAGGDLRSFANPPEDKSLIFSALMEMHATMRHIEKIGKPIVAAINGNALGGGLEFALACHHRIALDDERIRIGLPEVQLGLIPGGGGTQRLARLIGLPSAVAYILQSKLFSPQQAKEAGIISAVYADLESLKAAAVEWIQKNPQPVQAWDNKNYRIPQGGLVSPVGYQTMAGAIGNLRKQTHGNYPGATYALSAIHDALSLPIDRALEVEARYFLRALYSKEAKNLIRTGFFAINEAKKGKNKPANQPSLAVQTLGILGAGMMGAGIAYVSAQAGISVILKDISTEAAEKGKDYSRKLLAERVGKGKMSQSAADEILNRISCTADIAPLAAADMIIEAVFENYDLKMQLIREIEPLLQEGKIFASNTSTLPITALAKGSTRPANFIGLHFFSPVDKMPLLEIILGKETGDYAHAAAVDFAVRISKTPIVVHDQRGFFTSRVFGTFTGEAALMLAEGASAALIENTARRVGFPVSPLAVTDEVSLSLCLDVIGQTPKEQRSAHSYELERIYTLLCKEHGRVGKKAGKGFYEYPEGGKKSLWSGLADLFPVHERLDSETVGKRLLTIMSLESYRIYEEGVLRSMRDGDVGSLLGFGFPPYTGGVFSYIDYVGVKEFVATCEDFAQRFGERFAPPASLRERAKSGAVLVEG